jgi:predicted nucleic acid-binding protein
VVDARLTFVDTKILAYAHDRSETARQPVARALLEVLWRDRAGVLSTQALHVVATRRFDPPMARAAARELVVLDATWPVVQVDVP